MKLKRIGNKVFLTLASMYMGLETMFAQAGRDRIAQGTKALADTKAKVQGYYDPLADIIYIVAAIVGLIGAIKVYSKFSSGDPDTGKTAASWFGAAIFIVVAVYALKAMFIN